MIHTKLSPKGVPKWIKTVGLMLLFCSFKVIEGFAPAVDNPASVDPVRSSGIQKEQEKSNISNGVEVDVKVAGESIGKQSLTIKPVRKWEIYVLHHSHVDIGYTHVQTEVVRKHWEYFKQVIELARKSANYPAGSRFKWNVEVLWAVDVFNTCSWMRTDLVVLPWDMKVSGELIKGPDGKAVKSQRLSTGELAFLARDIAPFSAKRFTLSRFIGSQVRTSGDVRAQGAELSNLAEEKASKITGPIEMAAYEIVTLRVSPPGK